MVHVANGHTSLVTRRQSAALRLIERNERGEAGQIEALDARLGTGVGARKERARLADPTDPTTKTARKARRSRKGKS